MDAVVVFIALTPVLFVLAVVAAALTVVGGRAGLPRLVAAIGAAMITAVVAFGTYIAVGHSLGAYVMHTYAAVALVDECGVRDGLAIYLESRDFLDYDREPRSKGIYRPGHT